MPTSDADRRRPPKERLQRPIRSHLPAPRRRRQGIGLCLSGGGFRATLFHLGALRRLHELGLLERCRTIASVSGGSIMAAVLGTAIARAPRHRLSPAEWDAAVADPVRGLTRRNIRTWPLLARFVDPRKWFEPAPAVETLARRYRELSPLTLAELPEQPNFVFCATDLAFGVNWVFERRRMGDYQAGYVSPHPGDWPVARAVAASSCFPPFFDPLPIAYPARRFAGGLFPQGPERDRVLADLRLTDGGNYDNLALEPVWKQHEVVLVSDGGAIFEREPVPRLIWRRLSRYLAITDQQSRSVRKRWLIASFLTGVLEGAYWGVGGARSSYDPADDTGYPKDLATRVIARIRTDLDAFSEAEAAVLENHGYFVADAAIRTHLAHLVPADAPAPVVPHPAWLDPSRAERALAGSDRRQILGRW